MRPALSTLLLASALAAGTASCGLYFDDHAGFAECMGCHEEDRPGGHHEGQDCVGCHSTTSWEGGGFEHDDLFPTPHHGVSACNDCHLGGDTTDYTCTDCHEHSQSRTDGEHDEVGNYTYESHACFACHPRGSGEGEGGDDR